MCAVCGLTPSGSSMTSAFPWSAVIRHTPSAGLDALDDAAERAVGRLDSAVTAGIEPVWPTMSGFAKFTTANAYPSPISPQSRAATSAADISGFKS